MFVRTKPSGAHKYLQVVESFREGRKVRQRVVATLGRLDRLQAEGNIDGIVRSLSRFALKVRLVEGHKSGRLRAGRVVRIGPAIVVERLWRELGVGRVIEGELKRRKFGFPVERAVFLTVLHRLFASGSDRAADKWKRDHRIEGAADLSLHHLYRAMAWLGESKDAVEGSLFASTRDLFTELDMVFFDTTSIYFEGEGGETLGGHGHSKDHRPDLKQMVVGACLAGEVAVKYKQLWRVERAFRTVKSVLDTRPIYHKCDATIMGHVFASFLALVVMHEFDARLAAKSYRFGWEDVKRDLEALSEVEVFEGESAYWLRTEFAGCASKVFSALGIAAPPTVRGADA